MARYALPVVALIIAPLAFSQESTLEEVVITSSFTHQVQGQNERVQYQSFLALTSLRTLPNR